MRNGEFAIEVRKSNLKRSRSVLEAFARLRIYLIPDQGDPICTAIRFLPLLSVGARHATLN